MAGSERRVDLCDPAHPVWRRSGRLLGHGKGQKRQSEICAQLEVAVDHGPRQNLCPFVRMAERRIHLDKVPRAVTGAYLLADKARAPLKVMKQGDGLQVELPRQAPDSIASVLALTTA